MHSMPSLHPITPCTPCPLCIPSLHALHALFALRACTGTAMEGAMPRQLHAVGCNTRPGIVQAVNSVTKFSSCPDSVHMAGAQHLLKYLYAIRLKALTQGDKSDQKLRTGCVVPYNSGAILWIGASQQVVAQSTCEAEYVAAATATKEALYLTQLFD
eukprot:366422-Chlamydomonas_euryale.AAC.6